ncbi:MAG: peptidylprolyl isomerase, partial [Fidelibacterota bacterium]
GVAEEVRDLALAGEDFSNLAKTYSEDPSSGPQGGDLNWFKKGTMDPTFEEAAFSAKINEIVGPVLTRFGYHIIKVTDKKIIDGNPQIKASHILIKINTGPQTLDRLKSQLNLMAFDAETIGFEAAADSNGLTVKPTEPIKKTDSWIPAIGYMPKAVKFAFSKQIGEISEVMENKSGFAIFSLSKIIPESTKPLEEVKEQIKQSLIREKRDKAAKNLALEIFEKIKNGLTFHEILKEYKEVELKKPRPFKLSDAIPEIGRNNAFIGTLMELDSLEISEPIKVSRGYAVVQLMAKSKFLEEDYRKEHDKIKLTLLSQKQNAMLANWMESLRKKAKIKDYRSDFFD